MAMYRCSGDCDRLLADEDHPPVEDPRNDCELLCPRCEEELAEGE